MDANTEALIALGLFALSELIGMSKLKDNSLLELLLHMAGELFPYEVKRKGAPTRATRPRRRRTTTASPVSSKKP
jgi:hypothetical protein